MYDKDHPLWEVLRAALRLLSLIAILALTATNFDETELRTIASYLIVGEGASFLFKR